MPENVPPRNWQDVARELAREQNPSKCLQLSEELNTAIAEEERKGVPLFAKDQITRGDQS